VIKINDKNHWATVTLPQQSTQNKQAVKLSSLLNIFWVSFLLIQNVRHRNRNHKQVSLFANTSRNLRLKNMIVLFSTGNGRHTLVPIQPLLCCLPNISVRLPPVCHVDDSSCCSLRVKTVVWPITSCYADWSKRNHVTLVIIARLYNMWYAAPCNMFRQRCTVISEVSWTHDVNKIVFYVVDVYFRRW